MAPELFQGSAASTQSDVYSMGVTYFCLGRYNEALDLFDQARDFFIADGRHRDAILVELFTVFAVLASQRFATDRALHEHSHELLKNVVDETRENAAGFLQQAQDSVSLAAGIFEASTRKL